MPTRPVAPDAVTLRARYEVAFELHHRRVFAYALRRLPTEADAEDAVAETFAVAWRRVDRLPVADALPWLLAIARRVIANQRRGSLRRVRLFERLRGEQRPPAWTPTPTGPEIDALGALSGQDQELLRLLAWDGLSQREAGIVLGISENAVAIRLHRARKAFARALAKGSAASRTSTSAEGQLREGTP